MPSIGTPLKIGVITVVFLIVTATWIFPFHIPQARHSIKHGSFQHGSPASKNKGSSDRPLIVYAYHESDSARANLEYFVAKGLHNAADFVFIFNGDAKSSSIIPELPHVKIVKRENTCFDMGAIGEVLREGDLWKKYKRFITMNASIRGPFLPMWSFSCWTDLFLSKLTDKTKLVGMTLNCQPRLHVQSMIFATDDIGMGILLDPTIATSASEDDPFGSKDAPVGLSGCYADWNAAVHAEVGTTGLIMKSGYDVDVMMTSMHPDGDVKKYCKAHPDSGDVLWDKKYFGSNVHPYETIFIKANRDVDPQLMSSMTDWHLRMNVTSFDTCG
ncbi:uncharacterized protein CTRU02_206359 [Colletotrichum truncatum]|uniref:Uncharacterized protein n=1 Tax=Colletotrichum truncatum TaxID=5467 RepID=A0ACC3Z6P9_COLTU|nr:uncharacterized protein CTRU02_09803 [Colletotrichum truncatum]KAF6787990.1 hypothetical protein CTRU02_09803 [Colletotrichum truncatum]